MQNILFLIDNELIIIDTLSALKSHAYCSSPFIQSRSNFWEDQVELFPAYSSNWPCFYWNHGPMLELPERAASLENIPWYTKKDVNPYTDPYWR